jgi:cobaltochelatase CobS
MELVKHSVRTVRRPCRDCGSSDLYWAHDMSPDARGYGRECKAHGGTRSWVMMNRDESLHDCIGRYAAGGWSPIHDADTPGDDDVANDVADNAIPAMPVAAPARHQASPGDADRMRQLAMLLDMLAPKVDAEQVNQIVNERMREVIDMVNGMTHWTTIVVTDESGAEVRKVDGACHRMLPALIGDLQLRHNVMLVGPAGTGKSHMAQQAAEALGTEFYSIPMGPATPESRLVGYMDANGQYVRTLFREAYESGGVFLFDEIDNSSPGVLIVMNGALANGHMAFPDAMVARHPDFRCVATANTYGRGPDRKYVGRQAIDGTTLDRFTVETIDYDESLEEALCRGTGAAAAVIRDVLRYVRELRNAAEESKLALIFSPRASVGLCELLHAGRPVHDAIAVRVRKGISDQDWHKVSAGITTPAVCERR